jgi:hypothetical protein
MLKNLEYLNLSMLKYINSVNLEEIIKHMSNLKFLDLSHCDINDNLSDYLF